MSRIEIKTNFMIGMVSIIVGIFIGWVVATSVSITPEPALVEVHHTDTIVQFVNDSIQGPIDTLNILSAIGDDILYLNWQYFKTDTITDRYKTPAEAYDDVILIRRFYYRGGLR